MATNWNFDASHHVERSLSSFMMENLSSQWSFNAEPYEDIQVLFASTPQHYLDGFPHPLGSIVALRNNTRQRDRPDYGRLKILQGAGETRQINIVADFRRFEQYRQQLLDRMDAAIGQEKHMEEFPQGCRDVAWRHHKHPNCNDMHSTLLERPIENSANLQDYYVTYLSRGGFRNAWKLRRSNLAAKNKCRDDVVIKRYLMAQKYSLGEQELSKVHLEALVLEKLTSAPDILDIYGYCGTSVMIESMSSDVSKSIVPGNGAVDHSKLYKEGQFHSCNNLTVSEKLEIAISMAESLAKLHQFHGGVVVHADVNIEQWLLNNHGDLKLNDFNLAEILPWNDQTQQYCPFATRYDGGFRLVRSPEEFLGLPAGESKDVYSYGNTIYSLLTGLWPFHDELARKVDVAKRREAIYRGARPYIDERLNKTQSHIERQLLDVMYQCWHVDPNKRPTMVEVAAFLRTAKEVARAKGDLDTKSALIAI